MPTAAEILRKAIEEDSPELPAEDFQDDELIPPGTELISAPTVEEARPAAREKKKIISFRSRKKKDDVDEDMEAFVALLDKVNKSHDDDNN